MTKITVTIALFLYVVLKFTIKKILKYDFIDIFEM
jgi:hypothetical protein